MSATPFGRRVPVDGADGERPLAECEVLGLAMVAADRLVGAPPGYSGRGAWVLVHLRDAGLGVAKRGVGRPADCRNPYCGRPHGCQRPDCAAALPVPVVALADARAAWEARPPDPERDVPWAQDAADELRNMGWQFVALDQSPAR